ncbi:MAG: hypothetical protein KDA84_03140 [Planctomycetaceae bacterium]|nr:hypothetical protein [Planctomycetaceae bacterium]
MDQINEQLVLTITCVLVAVAVLVRRFVQFVRQPNGGGCHSGGCSRCPSRNATNSDGFISLDQLTNPDLQ